MEDKESKKSLNYNLIWFWPQTLQEMYRMAREIGVAKGSHLWLKWKSPRKATIIFRWNTIVAKVEAVAVRGVCDGFAKACERGY